MDKEIKTQIYQMSLWHKKFAEMLNIVVIVKTNLHTHKTAHVVLFSSDLTLRYDLLIDYYRCDTCRMLQWSYEIFAGISFSDHTLLLSATSVQ
jgi:hypothetical protein